MRVSPGSASPLKLTLKCGKAKGELEGVTASEGIEGLKARIAELAGFPAADQQHLWAKVEAKVKSNIEATCSEEEKANNKQLEKDANEQLGAGVGLTNEQLVAGAGLREPCVTQLSADSREVSLKVTREHKFYLISTLEEIIAIDASAAELEIYLKFYWQVEGLEEKIRAKEICVKEYDEGKLGNEKEIVLDEEKKAFMRGVLPSGKAFEYSLPVAPGKVFENERPWTDRKDITPPWTAFDCEKGVVSVQLHLHLKVKCPDPDLWKYPFNRRVLNLKLARRQDGSRRWRLLAKRPDWAGGGYHEDKSVLTVKWARDNASLLLKLRSADRRGRWDTVKGHLHFLTCIYCCKKRRERVAKQRDEKDRLDRQGNAVFVQMDLEKSKPSLLVLLERDPANFLWNVMLPNWILVSAAHLTLFMEFFTEKNVTAGVSVKAAAGGDAMEANKAVLAEQMGVTLAVLLAVLANKYVALTQELPSSLAFNTLADYYFVLSYAWLAFIIATNAILFLIQTHYDLKIEPVVDGGKTTHGIDVISGLVGMALFYTWLVLNIALVLASWTNYFCTKWSRVVEMVSRPDDEYGTFVDAKTKEKQNTTRRKSCVDLLGFLDPSKLEPRAKSD